MPNRNSCASSQNLYVLQRSWESGGRLFDAFFIQVLWCLFLMVLFVGAHMYRRSTQAFVLARAESMIWPVVRRPLWPHHVAALCYVVHVWNTHRPIVPCDS